MAGLFQTSKINYIMVCYEQIENCKRFSFKYCSDIVNDHNLLLSVMSLLAHCTGVDESAISR